MKKHDLWVCMKHCMNCHRNLEFGRPLCKLLCQKHNKGGVVLSNCQVFAINKYKQVVSLSKELSWLKILSILIEDTLINTNSVVVANFKYLMKSCNVWHPLRSCLFTTCLHLDATDYFHLEYKTM